MHVHVSVAASLDGKLLSRRREQMAIGGDGGLARMDGIYAIADAVAAGVRTAFTDDPYLTFDDPSLVTTREDRGDPLHPARVVTDSCARTPTNTRILDDAATTYPLVLKAAPGSRHETLEVAGAELVVVGTERVSLPDTLDAPEARGVDRLMIEGGGELTFSLSEAGPVDELALYVGSLVIGGRGAPTLADGDGFASDFSRLSPRDVERVGDGVLLAYDC